jgi:DNA-binding transcriptional ArsR family regulator
LKPLAAVARATGAPLAVALITGDPGRWRLLVQESSGGRHSDAAVFGFLAAQEAIEVAAILGDSLSQSDGNDLTPVWDWLSERTAYGVKEAIGTAVCDYRRQVVNRVRGAENGNPLALRVPLGKYSQLRKWCQEMERKPMPLGAEGVDIGLPLLFADGRIDDIRIASLYADVDSILSRGLPAKCFDLTRDPGDMWSLANGLPRIGALIAELGSVDLSVQAADRALALLPRGSGRLELNLLSVERGELARGFATLFRALEVHFADETMWEQIWNGEHWDPVLLDEAVSRAACPWVGSLSDWIKRTERALIEATAEEAINEEPHPWADIGSITAHFIALVRKELGENLAGMTPGAVAVHLGFLQEMELVESRSCVGGYEYRTRTPQIHINRPRRPEGDGTRLKWASAHLQDELMDSLGFGSRRGPATTENFNAIGRVLYAAFLATIGSPPPMTDQARLGRAFLESFLRGEAPGWVIEVCREFVRTGLAWTDAQTWPRSILGRDIG